MNAKEFTASLGGRWNGRNGLANCPAHNDRNPSFSIADKGGRVVFICRAGCTQQEILDALHSRGLWNALGQIITRGPASRWEEHLQANALPSPSCCRRGPEHGEPVCIHWKELDADMTIARLHGNLREAAAEVVELFQIVRSVLNAGELCDELKLAVEVGASAIVPWYVTGAVVGKVIGLVVAEVLADAAARAA